MPELEELQVPSTHTSLNYHVVFSTKERRNYIEAAWCGRLHEYLGGAVRSLGGVPLAIGGTGDHVHLLISLSGTHRLAEVVRDVKTASSKWVHETIGSRLFAWQEGYGAFTVSPSNRDAVCKYVLNQEEHHRKKSFQEEYRELLERAGVQFEEKYLW
ncbi:MAG TPA: IS200/IS605 family transposase [Verrucomicrobiae bacterium]